MSDSEIVKNAGEMITASDAGDMAGFVIESLSSAGGVLLRESGKIALGALIRPRIKEFFRRF